MEKQRHLGLEIRNVNNLIKRYFEQNKPEEFKDGTIWNVITNIHGWAIRYFYENRNNDVFQRDFETRFSIRRSTATNMLKLMEKNGLITRVSVPYDARLKKIVLTEKAIEIHNKATQNIAVLEESIKDGITEQELIAFYNVLDKVKFNLEVKK